MVNKKSILIFNKVPLEKALNRNDVEKWINNATIKADRNNISGKELTPFLIKEINEQSKNKTLKTKTPVKGRALPDFKRLMKFLALSISFSLQEKAILHGRVIKTDNRQMIPARGPQTGCVCSLCGAILA